jgi:cytochrome c5
MKQSAQVARITVINLAGRAMFALLAAALVLFVMQNFAHAQGAERSGKDVVDSTCAKCHASGAQGAPKIGDKQAWSKLSEQGLSGLTKVALEGIRKMPPHGANMKLTDTEIKRAVTYMINQSGGNWIEPTSKKSPPAPRTGEQIVKAQCSKCHEKGLHGAPKIGDRDAWIPRLKDGLDPVVRSAINGHGPMPARGGMADLTDAEMRDAITYMFNKGRVPEKAAK